jgi:hypothetical protein
MKFNIFAIVGVVVIALGIAGLVHPRVVMPSSHREVEIGKRKVIMETRRIVDVPPILGGVIILCGAGMVFLGVWKK